VTTRKPPSTSQLWRNACTLTRRSCCTWLHAHKSRGELPAASHLIAQNGLRQFGLANLGLRFVVQEHSIYILDGEETRNSACRFRRRTLYLVYWALTHDMATIGVMPPNTLTRLLATSVIQWLLFGFAQGIDTEVRPPTCVGGGLPCRS
jgi:hypothetical protein